MNQFSIGARVFVRCGYPLQWRPATVVALRESLGMWVDVVFDESDTPFGSQDLCAHLSWLRKFSALELLADVLQ